MGLTGEAGAEPLLGNYFCDSCGPCPGLCPGHRPRPKGQAPHLCFSGAPPSQKGGWAQIWGTGSGESELGAALPAEENSGAGQLLLAPPPPPSLAQPCPCPSSQLLLEPQRASPGRQEDEGARAPRGALLRPLTHYRERGRETASRACRSSSNEGAGAARQENAGSSPGATRWQPAPGPPSLLQSFCHPLPARENLGSKPCGPSRGHPGAREQKTKDEALARGPHRPGVCMRRGWQGHWPQQSTLLPSQPHSRLAASLSLQPSGPPDTHPNMA